MDPIQPTIGSTFLYIPKNESPRLCIITDLCQRRVEGAWVVSHFTLQAAARKDDYILEVEIAKRDDGILLPPVIMRVVVSRVPWDDRLNWHKALRPHLLADTANIRLQDKPDDPCFTMPGMVAHVWSQTQPFSLFPGETYQARATAIAVAHYRASRMLPHITVTFSSFVGDLPDTVTYRFDETIARQFADQGYL